MTGSLPPPLTPDEAAEFHRRRRPRNIALLIVLIALATLFYALTMTKFH